MKIRSIELTNFRKFVGTVRVENIGDNVNVLVGRNELGKSTLLEAINGVIFEKAKSAAGHVKAFRHFVNGTVPEVKLAFEKPIGGLIAPTGPAVKPLHIGPSPARFSD
jgi:predicted ATP-dependent endonuclease of OLD family